MTRRMFIVSSRMLCRKAKTKPTEKQDGSYLLFAGFGRHGKSLEPKGVEALLLLSVAAQTLEVIGVQL